MAVFASKEYFTPGWSVPAPRLSLSERTREANEDERQAIARQLWFTEALHKGLPCIIILSTLTVDCGAIAMPCYHPVTGYRTRAGRSETGAWPVVFSQSQGYKDLPVVMKCGQCIGCRLDKSREWAIRCVNESSLYQNNCFITLTYNDYHVDKLHSLVPRDYVLFMKRLRKAHGPNIRFFHCGEYGEKFQRPHHHACLFNFNFSDRKLWKIRSGVRLYTSEELSRLWTDPETERCFGYSTIGDVTFESAAYVARYVTKKITGKKSDAHYGDRRPEYVTMSRNPGIGDAWIRKYIDDVYPEDQVVARDNIICKPPRFYDNVLDDLDTDTLSHVKAMRRKHAKEHQLEYDRRLVKEQVKLKKFEKLLRSYESELQV